jgi:hypothetical protein
METFQTTPDDSVLLFGPVVYVAIRISDDKATNGGMIGEFAKSWRKRSLLFWHFRGGPD